MVQTSMIVVYTDGGDQNQSLIDCGTNQIIFSENSTTLPYWISSPFAITANGYQYVANLTNTSPPSGTIGERIQSVIGSGSAVSLTTATPANITSISLTAGIWDACALMAIQGVLAGTDVSGTITANSATPGTSGDNLAQIGLLALSSAQMLTIPSYRIELNSTTTIYLVANATFTLGTVSGYGRLSATRVG